MSTPATLRQGHKLQALLIESRATSDEAQIFLENGDLVAMMLRAANNLSGVDRAAFQALLDPSAGLIDWTPVSRYADKIREWNVLFALGLSDEQIDGLAAKLPDHAGPLLPTGISLIFGNSLFEDWKVATRILKHELAKLGGSFTDYFEREQLSYCPGSVPLKGRSALLDVALLDIGTFWDPTNGINLGKFRRQRSRWPVTEVAWLLALNPQVCLSMDGKTIPYLLVAGMDVDLGSLAYFHRDSKAVCAERIFGSDPWRPFSAVAFR